MRASVSASARAGSSRPVVTAAAIEPATRPWVRIRRRRYAMSVAQSRTSPCAMASSTPPECTCEPVGNRESASDSSSAVVCAESIRTGNIVAP
ncbi:Uncharacterised protein [Mycobacteroides abscessus subsp. abscessus]|nr:Uncharacterised protein [Mycobacteroides abscessus subsp. abscessus]